MFKKQLEKICPKSLFSAIASITFIISTFLIFQNAAHAKSFDEIVMDLEKAIRNDASINAKKLYYKDLGEGTFCKKEQEFAAYLSTKIGKLDLNIGPQNEAVVNFNLKDTKIYISAFRTGGVLCTPMGGAIEINLAGLETEFAFLPRQASDEFVRVDFRSLKINGLKLNDALYSIPFAAGDKAQIPEWANEWLEKNFNRLVAYLLTTKIKEKIDLAIGKKVTKSIEEIGTGGGL